MLSYAILSFGLIVGYLIIKPSLIRSSKQPVSFDSDNEDIFLSYLLSHPKFWAEASIIQSIDFSQEAARKLWSEVDGLIKKEKIYPLSENSSDKLVKLVAEKIPSDIMNRLEYASIGNEYINKLKALSPTYEEAYAAGQLIINDSLDRGEYNGLSEIRHNGDTFYRVLGEPSVGRKIWSPSVAAIALLFGYYLSAHSYRGPSMVLSFLTIVALTVSTLEWALVDIDTMYLDMKYFIIGSVTTYLLTVATLFTDHRLKNIIPGLLVVGVFLILLEISNFIFRRIKGTNGMGFGDYYILVTSVGVPTMLSGSWFLGYRIIMLSLMIGIVGWGIGYTLGKTGRDKPFAFGPYLALGWVVAVITWNYSLYGSLLGF